MLNVQQILEEGLLKLDNAKGKPAQVGYDITLKEVNIVGFSDIYARPASPAKVGKVLKDKTELTNYTALPPIKLDGHEGWLLHPGTYDLVFNEGCKIPVDRVAFIKQRSSLWRNGALINSPLFDPGFETENMGTTMIVTEPIFIEKDARVAQIYFHECTPAKKYDGQWQGDRQRSVQTQINFSEDS